MSRASRDGHGLVRQQGRWRTRPFGSTPDWPQRSEDLGAMQSAESAAQERRAQYRQQERQQPCGGCGAAPGFPHNLGCATPWG